MMTPKQLAAKAKASTKPVAAPVTKPKTAAKSNAADPAEVAEYCAANGAAHLSGDLIREKASMDEVKVKVGVINQIMSMTKAARATGCAIRKDFEKNAIASGLSVETVRDLLFDDLVAKQSPEIRGHISAGNLTRAGVAVDQGWARAVAEVNARGPSTKGRK